MFGMLMVRAMENLPHFNYSFTWNASFMEEEEKDDTCPKCGREGCTCDPDTCDCEPTPKQDELVQDFEE